MRNLKASILFNKHCVQIAAALGIVVLLLSCTANSRTPSHTDSNEMKERFLQSSAAMYIRNMYHTILWDMSPSTEYQLDQTKGQIHYTNREKNLDVYASLAILGTFNTEDDTFLWADKNPSLASNLTQDVPALRASLPEPYRQDKFTSTTGWNNQLLALFSHSIDASGFDSQRYNATIVYVALKEVNIFKNGQHLQTADPRSAIALETNDSLLALIKEFHRKTAEIDRLYYHAEAIDWEEAFKRIQRVHLQYWLNEDEYYFPSLSWPSKVDENVTSNWRVCRIDGQRVFVMYTSNRTETPEYYAYEIDPHAAAPKVIIGEYYH